MVRALLFVVLWFLAVYGSVASWAQDLVDSPPPEFDESVDVWVTAEDTRSPLYRDRLTDLYGAQMHAGRLSAVVTAMTADFARLDWGENADIKNRIIQRVTKFSAALDSVLSLPQIEGALNSSAEQGVFIRELERHGFNRESFRMLTMSDRNGKDVTGYFDGTADAFVVYEVAEDGVQFRLLLKPKLIRSWRLLSNSLSALLGDQTQILMTANVQSLEDAVARWENYLDHGYSQMPWESAFNGWAIDPPGFPKLGPPSHQWILLHPTAGLEVNTPFNDMRVNPALNIELAGHIFYTGRDLDNFFGVSAVASLREDLPPGLGFLLHFRRHWSAGLTWRDQSRDPFIYTSFDLFRFAKEEPQKYVGRFNRVVNNLP